MAIVRGNKAKDIARKVWKIEACKEHLVENLVHITNKECKDLCSTVKPSLFRETDANSISTSKFEDLKNELELRAPVLSKILRAAMRTTDDTCIPLTTVAAVILKWRNMHMSRIHHMVGQILDHGGATDEVYSLINVLVH